MDDHERSMEGARQAVRDWVNKDMSDNGFKLVILTYLGALEADTRDGRELGIQGTPTVFINGERIIGAQPYDVFAAVIARYLR